MLFQNFNKLSEIFYLLKPEGRFKQVINRVKFLIKMPLKDINGTGEPIYFNIQNSVMMSL